MDALIENVFVVNGIWADTTSYDDVFVVNRSGGEINPGEYKQVNIINGMHEDARPAKYRNVRITNGLPDTEMHERVYVVNFDALKDIDQVRTTFFPNTIKCPLCWHIFEILPFLRPFEPVNCPKCGHVMSPPFR